MLSILDYFLIGVVIFGIGMFVFSILQIIIG